MEFKTVNVKDLQSEAYIFFTFEDEKKIQEVIKEIEAGLNITFPKFITADFKGKSNQTELFYAGDKRIILSGLGKKEKYNPDKLRKATARAVKKAAAIKIKSAAVSLFDDGVNDPATGAKAQAISSVLGLYSFKKYYTSGEKREGNSLNEISFFTSGKIKSSKFEKAVENGKIIGEAVNFARDLGNEPSNILYPASLADMILKRSKNSGYEVQVMKKSEIEKLKMGGVLNVAKGSRHEPRFLVLKYSGGKDNEKPVVLIGKGVTFDSGGISIKPSAGMGMMKLDMGGASAVLGAFEAVSNLKLKKNVIGLVPLVENMPGGNSYKPGDVITAYNGMTIEVDNTDAEGRLILADAVSYAEKFNPKYIIDLATLTGAAIIALGHYATIAMGNNENLINKIKSAGERSGEKIWELPLWDDYDNLIDSDIADVRNTGKDRSAGTIIGGMFIKRFVSSNIPWVHLDIAGTGMMNTESDLNPKYATGVGVRLLAELLEK